MKPVRGPVLAAVAIACVSSFVAATLVSPPHDPLPFDPFWLVWTGFPVVGALILIKRTGNRVGLLQLLIGLSAAISALMSFVYEVGSADAVPVLINQLAFAPIFILVPMLVLVFPSGRLPSPRWRPFVRSAVVVAVILAGWLAVRPVEYSMDNVAFYPNPLAVDAWGPLDPWVMGIGQLALALFAVAAVTSAIIRLRRADTVGRLQVKWVVVPALTTPLLFLFATGVEVANSELWRVSNVLGMIAILAGGNGIAAGIGVAVFRHNLYGIDKIVSRTVSYTLVVAFLALAFFGLVTGLTTFMTSDEPLVIAIATLAVAALFNPVRNRVLRWVNRRFNRSSYRAEIVVGDFSEQLRDSVDPDSLVDGWVAVVEETVQPKTVGVWVRN